MLASAELDLGPKRVVGEPVRASSRLSALRKFERGRRVDRIDPRRCERLVDEERHFADVSLARQADPGVAPDRGGMKAPGFLDVRRRVDELRVRHGRRDRLWLARLGRRRDGSGSDTRSPEPDFSRRGDREQGAGKPTSNRVFRAFMLPRFVGSDSRGRRKLRPTPHRVLGIVRVRLVTANDRRPKPTRSAPAGVTQREPIESCGQQVALNSGLVLAASGWTLMPVAAGPAAAISCRKLTS